MATNKRKWNRASKHARTEYAQNYAVGVVAVNLKDPKDRVAAHAKLPSLRDWYRLFPKEIERKLIDRTRDSLLDQKAGSILDALRASFNWHSTPEGYVYWERLYLKLMEKKYVMGPDNRIVFKP